MHTPAASGIRRKREGKADAGGGGGGGDVDKGHRREVQHQQHLLARPHRFPSLFTCHTGFLEEKGLQPKKTSTLPEYCQEVCESPHAERPGSLGDNCGSSNNVR
eukprot:6723958-Pyramimonas_sp.AAC.1